VVQEQSAASPDWMVWLVLLGTVVGLARVWRRAPRVVAYSLVLMVVPVVVVIVARPAEQYARFFAFIPPFLLTALAAGGAATASVVTRWLPARWRLLAWAPAIIGAGILLRGWALVFADFQADEGFRAGVQALEANTSDSTALCAIGAGAELFQWYASKPLPLPKTINELQQVGRRASELRCIARPASWESHSNAELRRYVEERSTTEEYGDIVVYRLRRAQ